MYAGIDIGSSSSKAAIMDETGRLLSSCVVNLGTGTKGSSQVMELALREAGISQNELRYTVATGYGRLTYAGADRQITEITCHAKGVSWMAPGTRTIIDIGGQDAKVIKLARDGSVENFVMNEKCAAGTGRFLEVMARVLGCGIGELSELAAGADKEVSISSVCTVFAESEVISRLASGETIRNVARGAHRAIAKRVAGMCNRVGYEPEIIMTGGVALNSDMVLCMGEELGERVKAAPGPQEAGAVGAALLAVQLGGGKEIKYIAMQNQ